METTYLSRSRQIPSYIVQTRVQAVGKKERRAKRKQKAQRKPRKTAAGNQLLPEALKLHQAGRITEAERLYRQDLQIHPNNAETWHLLGMLKYQAEQTEEAIEYIQKALALRKDVPEFYSNLGVVYRSAGKRPQAAESLQHAIRLKPDYVDAWNNLGVVRLEQGRLDDAETCFQQVIQQQPDHVLALSNLGNVLKQLGRYEDADLSYRQVLDLEPDHFETFNNLGTVRHAQGRLDEAAAMYAQAIQLAPSFVEAHNNLGNLFKAQGQFHAAMSSYRHALQLQPDLASAHNNLGHLLKVEGRLQEAVSYFRQAIAIDPEYALAHNNLGSTLSAQGEVRNALACYREALRLKPDYAEAHSNYLFCLSGDPELDPEQLFAEHVKWGEIHGVPQAVRPHLNHPDPTRRLRIGYVSPDFRDHAVARYFEPTLAHHNPNQVEVTCYAEVLVPDEMTARLRSLADRWRSTCGMTDGQVADQVRADQIDILVDLAGHTANNRLKVFAYKPAPIQVTWLGYPNTTGLSAIDYRLTNAVQDRLDEPGQHVEELVRLPHGASCFAPPQQAPDVAGLPARVSGRVTFGSLHRLEKLNHQVLDLWCNVLHAVPGSRLLVLWPTLHGPARSNLEQQFTLRGIAAERLDLRHQADARGHLGVYDEIDIGLDVFPWAGGTTMREALWMGVVLLALRGGRPGPPQPCYQNSDSMN